MATNALCHVGLLTEAHHTASADLGYTRHATTRARSYSRRHGYVSECKGLIRVSRSDKTKTKKIKKKPIATEYRHIELLVGELISYNTTHVNNVSGQKSVFVRYVCHTSMETLAEFYFKPQTAEKELQ